MKKNIVVILFVIICLIILSVFLFNNNFKSKVASVKDEYQDYTPQEEISEAQYRETIVNLYFLNSETKELTAEARPIDVKQLVANPYKTLVSLLIDGTKSDKLQSIIPDGTVIYDASIEGGLVIINLSKDFLNYNGDESLKNNIINSISKTLCELNEVNNVSFLIEGKEEKGLSDIYSVI